MESRSDKTSSTTKSSQASSAKNDKESSRRAKTCQPYVRKNVTKYLTTGRQINKEALEEVEKMISESYKIPRDLDTLENVKEFWRKEKEKKIKEGKRHHSERHNYRSRLNLAWKRERLFVASEDELPGKCMTEDIDPDYFKMTSGRPIKEKKDIRGYVNDLRNCFFTKLKIGYHLDDILLIDESYKNEMKKLTEVKKNFLSCLKCFESFLKEDHESSATLLEIASQETAKSEEKLATIKDLREELKKVRTDVMDVEEKWRNFKMFQKFLYVVSPSEWRKIHDLDFERKDLGVTPSDPCGFDREFPGDVKIDLDLKIARFKEDVRQSQPPALYFTDPQQLLDILEELEKNNLIVLAHCSELDFPAENIMAELEKTKIRLEQDQAAAEGDIKFLTRIVEKEEEKRRADEEKLREIVFGLFRDLITDEDYLSVTSYVEDVYEDAVASNDNNLDPLTMIKEIELKYEGLLLALDKLPNDMMVKTTREFYRQQKRELKEALEAEKKVHQLEILLKRLMNSLTPPKKGVKERKIVSRSEPPPEQMRKFKLPKIYTREEKEKIFFFGKTSDSVKIHKPLYA